VTLLWQGGWTRWSAEVPLPTPNILWFCVNTPVMETQRGIRKHVNLHPLSSGGCTSTGGSTSFQIIFTTYRPIHLIPHWRCFWRHFQSIFQDDYFMSVTNWLKITCIINFPFCFKLFSPLKTNTLSLLIWSW